MIASRKTAAVGSETTQIVSNTIGRIILCSPAAQPAGRDDYRKSFQINFSGHAVSSAAFSDRSEVATHDPNRLGPQSGRRDVVLVRPSRGARTGGILYRPHPQGRQSSRPPGAAADDILADRQPQDCEGARPHYPTQR